MFVRRLIVLFTAFTVLAGGETAVSQTSEPGDIGLVHPAGVAGIGRYRVNDWGVVEVEIINNSDEPRDVLSTMYFSSEPLVQFGRQLWLPEKTTRRALIPVLPPETAATLGSGASIETMIFNPDSDAGNEKVIRGRYGEMTYDGLLPLNDSEPITAHISASETGDFNYDNVPRMAAIALRKSADLTRRVSVVTPRNVPPLVEGLDVIEQLVISGGELLENPAGMMAVKNWLFGGGHLWLMLDRVDPELVRHLLGDRFQCDIIDRVGLIEFSIESRDSNGDFQVESTQEYELPAEFVRVVPHQAEVVHWVNGWPASMWINAGRGKVLITTLDAKAWIRPRTDDDPKPVPSTEYTSHLSRPPLAQLADEFCKPVSSFEIASESIAPYLTEQIGYEIVDRSWVAAVLGTFCTTFLIAGIWLGRRQRLEWIGAIGPAVAIIAAIAIWAPASQMRQVVPSTVASFQHIDASVDSSSAQVQGVLAIFNNAESSEPIGSDAGGVFWPEMGDLGGSTRRMIWSDLVKWRWTNLTLPIGVRLAPFEQSVEFDQPLAAHAMLGPTGLTGRVECENMGPLADALIATGFQRKLAIPLDDLGAFTAGVDEVLPAGTYIDSTLLNDEQRRRQSVYEQIFPDGEESRFGDTITLLAWGNPVETGFAFAEGSEQVGSALVEIPLTLDRTPPNTEVMVPSPLMRYRAVDGPMEERGSRRAYDDRRDEWVDIQSGATVWLQFQLPQEVLPIELRSAHLSLRINAPERTMEILGIRSGNIVTLDSRTDPVGPFSFDIDEQDVLQPNLDGHFLIGIRIGHVDPEKALTTSEILENPWRMDYVQLDVSGTTLDSDD